MIGRPFLKGQKDLFLKESKEPLVEPKFEDQSCLLIPSKCDDATK